MHQFITQPEIEGKQLTITEDRLVHQLRNVLRMQSGDRLLVQVCDETRSSRYTCQIEQIDKKQVTCTIESSQNNVKDLLKTCIVALPNKRDKLELIVQKLAEIGVDQLLLRTAERSIMREVTDKRLERLQLIMTEAIEQSHGWFLMHIDLIDQIPFGHFQQLIQFDADGKEYRQRKGLEIGGGDKAACIIGPEGGFTSQEYELFAEKGVEKLSLGESVLRMETAAIIGGRHMMHQR